MSRVSENGRADCPQATASADGVRQNQLQCCKVAVLKIWYNKRSFHMSMLDEIRAKRDEIYAIARRRKAEKLWVFGSCARREVES